MNSTRVRVAAALAAVLLCASAARSQEPPRAGGEPGPDSIGRDTPRGTLLGFMASARKGNFQVAGLYLNTTARDSDVAGMARQLYVVLDTRLPARLRELSDRPDGSLANPLKPNQDVVGTIATRDGSLDIVVERVAKNGRLVWLFSRQTIDAIPGVYEEGDLIPVDRYVPEALTRTRVAGLRLFSWLALLLLPLVYSAIGLLGVPFGRAWAAWRAVRAAGPTLVPGPARLLALALIIRWLTSILEIPFVERQFWITVVAMLGTASIVWVALIASAFGERRLAIRLQLRGASFGDTAGILRLARRATDLLAITAGVLVLLKYFGVDPTAALAGLGIGGIAVALSAQKTLENVIGGLSIVADQAVRVGDFMKIGDTLGTVDFIGLRSTRIRTLDRTMLTVPNGQLAGMSVETLSARDKFWFHHVVGLRYETTAVQMRAVVDEIRGYLAAHPAIDRSETLRVRFFRFGPFSLDVDVFAYVIAADWEPFLEVQQELMIEIMAIVERAGASIALPAQRLHVVESARAVTAGPVAG